jgi:hypothetical protein
MLHPFVLFIFTVHLCFSRLDLRSGFQLSLELIFIRSSMGCRPTLAVFSTRLLTCAAGLLFGLIRFSLLTSEACPMLFPARETGAGDQILCLEFSLF